MLQTLGAGNRRELALLLAIIALVAVTPLGREGTSAIVLVVYRLLLIVIAIGSILLIKDNGGPEVSPGFIGLCGIVLLLMLTSILVNPGSRFAAFYQWYQFLLFGAAFIAMAALNRQRSILWKRTILWSIIVIDLIYVAAALITRQRPLLGPFVNPNYFASYLLAGFAAAVAIAQFEKDRMIRIAAAGSAVVFYYAMTQAFSRGAAIAALGVAVLSVIRFTEAQGISRIKVFIIIALVLVAGAAASPSLIRKFLDRGQVDPYNYQRPSLWLSALRVIGRNPVLGVGPGEYYHVSKRFSPAVEGTVARYMKRPGRAHSEYLQYAAESGLPAAILLFTLAGYLVVTAIRRTKHCSPEQRVFQEAAILVAAGLGMHALVDNNWDVPVMASGLVVFSLADVMPLSDWQLRLAASARAITVVALILIMVIVQAVLIPGLSVHFNESGQEAYSRDDLVGAEAMYRLASALEPNSEVFLDNAGTVYFDKYMQTHERRWLNFAEDLFVQAGIANPNSEDPGRHLESVFIQHLTGDPAKDQSIHVKIVAIDRAILTIDPFNVFIRTNLAEALYNSGSREEARQELVRAIELEPNYVPAYLRLSEWLKETGNLAESDQYRANGLSVAMRFRDVKTIETYEAMLLGRPVAHP